MTRFEGFHKLTSASLRDLAASLRGGPLATGVPAHAVQQITGAALAGEVRACIEQLRGDGWSAAQLAAVAEAIERERGQAQGLEGLFDLVLSGPDVPGVPTRATAAVMHALLETAQQEVILVGYAVHNGQKLFERLAQRMAERPALDVWFCLNIERKPTDTSLASEIVRRFARDFAERHWPWQPKPAVYYDPRALDDASPTRSSLHAKCVIVDRREALVTSANFTHAAHRRNIEAGVVIRHVPFVERLAGYFAALRESGMLRCVPPV